MNESSDDRMELMRQKPFLYDLQIRGDTIRGKLCRVVEDQSTDDVVKLRTQILVESQISMNVRDTDSIDDVKEISETVSAAAFMTMETLHRVNHCRIYSSFITILMSTTMSLHDMS